MSDIKAMVGSRTTGKEPDSFESGKGLVVESDVYGLKDGGKGVFWWGIIRHRVWWELGDGSGGDGQGWRS
jgi:hypothetical protein